MKLNGIISVFVYKLLLIINLINGKLLNDKDKNGKCQQMILNINLFLFNILFKFLFLTLGAGKTNQYVLKTFLNYSVRDDFMLNYECVFMIGKSVFRVIMV